MLSSRFCRIEVRLPLPFICVIAAMTGFLFRVMNTIGIHSCLLNIFSSLVMQTTITIVFLCKIIVFDLLNLVMQEFKPKDLPDVGDIIFNAFFEGLRGKIFYAVVVLKKEIENNSTTPGIGELVVPPSLIEYLFFSLYCTGYQYVHSIQWFCGLLGSRVLNFVWTTIIRCNTFSY